MGEMIDWLDNERPTATLGVRRGLIGIVLFGLAAYVGGMLGRWPVLTLAGLVAMAGAWWRLQRAIGVDADVAHSILDHHLDHHREQRWMDERDRAYLASYRVVGAVVAALVIAFIGWDVFGDDHVSTRTAQTAVGALLFFVIALPSCIIGWSQQPPTRDVGG